MKKIILSMIMLLIFSLSSFAFIVRIQDTTSTFNKINATNITIKNTGVNITDDTVDAINVNANKVNATYGHFLGNLTLGVQGSNICFDTSCIDSWSDLLNSSTANSTYLNLSGTNANRNINISPYNLELNNMSVDGSIQWAEHTGVQRLFYINPIDGDGFRMEYWYDFEAANDDWLVFKKTDGNDNVPDGGIAFMMQNSSGQNRTILKLDGIGLANFTDYNINTRENLTVEGYIYGQPITGSIGSGIIWANGTNSFAEVNVNCTGLTCQYNAFKVRLVNTSNHESYCYVPAGNVALTDNQHSVFYVDKSCTVKSMSMQAYVTTSISPGGIIDFANVITHNGASENINGLGLENKRMIKLRKLLLAAKNPTHLSVSSGFTKSTGAFPNFNISSGEYVYLMDIVPVPKLDTTVNGIELVAHNSSGGWQFANSKGLNTTYCDTGTGIAPCTNTNKYRRSFIFIVGNNDTGINTGELHQLYPLESTSYSTVGECLDITTFPLSYTLPAYYDYGAVLLWAYCGRASDTAWTTNFIDLRTVKSASSSVGVDLSIFLTKDGSTLLTGSWNAGPFDIVANSINASWPGFQSNYTAETGRWNKNNASAFWTAQGPFNADNYTVLADNATIIRRTNTSWLGDYIASLSNLTYYGIPLNQTINSSIDNKITTSFLYTIGGYTTNNGTAIRTVVNITDGYYQIIAKGLNCTNCLDGTQINPLVDADISDTLTCSDLVAGSSVVSDAEVDNDLTINTNKQMTLQDDVWLCLGTDCDMHIVYNTTAGYAELG